MMGGVENHPAELSPTRKRLVAPLLLIANPASGRHDKSLILKELCEFLRTEDLAVNPQLTTSASHTRQLVARHGPDSSVMLVLGGDGTIHDAANGLPPKLAPPIIGIPYGTENLLAVVLGWRNHPSHVLDTIRNGKTERLDVVRINDGPERFLMVGGAGFDAQVLHYLEHKRKGRISRAHYTLPMLKAIWYYDYPPIRVVADGELVVDEPAVVLLGNIPRYGLKLPIFDRARWNDGMIDVCIYRGRHRRHLLMHLFRTYMNRHRDHPSVSYLQARHVRIECERALPMEFDGDVNGCTPVELTVEPTSLKVILPPE